MAAPSEQRPSLSRLHGGLGVIPGSSAFPDLVSVSGFQDNVTRSHLLWAPVCPKRHSETLKTRRVWRRLLVEVGEQLQRPTPLGPQDAEVPVVESRDLVFPELLAGDEDRRIDQADGLIAIAVLQTGR